MDARWSAAVLGTVVAVGAAHDARAFCGFYVSGADAKLTNDATQVVLMRDGTRTVISMQNDYHGPPEDFAMVVPVPVVLRKENVKTLERAVFDRVDQLTAPRLVEYWEEDPCPRPMNILRGNAPKGMAYPSAAVAGQVYRKEAVKIEAQFSVGEYDIVVLSASDAMALDTWLRQNNYKIPTGAEPYLRPYVQMGMKFFVAKVDIAKVQFERVGNGPDRAILSPIRFHYDSDAFDLPIRLGLINSAGTQDLVVTILARNQRYEVANYDNVAMPTNIDVSDATRNEFGAFYTTLFDRTLARHPRSVVTEYSWQTTSCDPCPTPPLEPAELMTLGADVLPANATGGSSPVGGGAPIVAGGGLPSRVRPRSLDDFVVTRLHARYSREALGDDLYFRAAPPVVGGREFVQSGGKLEQGARPDSSNNFQARYVIRHPWTGPIACRNPQRGVWGGPPGGGSASVTPAAKIGFAPRGGAATLATFLGGSMPAETFLSSGGVTPMLSLPTSGSGPLDAAPGEMAPGADRDDSELGALDAAAATPLPLTAPPQGGCAGCALGTSDASGAGAVAALLALALTRLRRREV